MWLHVTWSTVVVGNMHVQWSLRETTSNIFFFKGASQHRNLLSHLGVIELDGDMREREREGGRERSMDMDVCSCKLGTPTHVRMYVRMYICSK